MEQGLHIESEDFLIAFELMEGKECLERSMRSESYTSIKSAREEFRRLNKKGNRKFYVIIIYGKGGWNRYYVNDPGGMVYFSIPHCISQEKVRDALALGFRVLGSRVWTAAFGVFLAVLVLCK